MAFFGVGAWALFHFEAMDEANWEGGILFDEAVRGGLRLADPEARRAAAGLSDAVALGLVAWTYGDVAGALAATRDRRLVSQWAGINALSFSATMFVNQLTKRLTRRARPGALPCTAPSEPEGTAEDPRCEDPDQNRSFFSGHTAFSFTSASLLCVHHGNLPVYGGGSPDALACASALGLAATVGLLRVVSDRHYLSDVLVGALVGFLSGFVLPSLVYYR
jgi:membrane-associated phospholipid phosphatase